MVRTNKEKDLRYLQSTYLAAQKSVVKFPSKILEVPELLNKRYTNATSYITCMHTPCLK